MDVPMASDGASTGITYPASFEFDPPDRVANWRPLVHWLLAIPHLAILYAMQAIAEVLSIISWFSIVFTGKVPAGIVNFQAMTLRYALRTFSYYVFMREEYPPFTFVTTAADPGEDNRVRVDFEVQLEDRNRLTTAFRLILVIPSVIVLAFLALAAFFVGVVGFFAVLFTGRWPEGGRQFVLRVASWWLRLQSYILLLHDEYPPFSLS